MAEVLVMIPSRGRPESLLTAWESIRDTSKADLIAYVDNDQVGMYEHLPAVFVTEARPGTSTYHGLRGPSRFVICTGPRVGPVNAINWLCHGARPGGGLRSLYPDTHIFTYLTDDSTIGPPGWDNYLARTIASFPKEIGVVSLDHGAPYVNFYAISTNMVEAIGYYGKTGLHAWFWDTAMELIGDATRIVYADPQDVSVNHQTQVSSEPSQGFPDEDCREFARWCITDRKRAIKSVREAMNELR